MKKVAVALSSALLSGVVAHASPPTSTESRDFASNDVVRAQVAAMLADMKQDQGFSWRPLVEDGAHVVAIEIWKKPGRPAVHPTEAEYAIVLEGTGTLVSGGALIAPVQCRDDLVEGETIEGGTTRPLHPGDVLLLPAGVPHWFGITGDRLVLLGTKLPGKR